ncbi:membrane protein [Enterococcus haemoperoxidus ATCC BAA-382]|uniref:Membrane protein n=1 Tax=Enterococcus haemoperoxidus ATCC BAA-382 TaxID=1158608 RepID=R2QSI6_9ENTE|nr:AI-2E family transporter [Enterococcus haemoperoxidus]EOH99467.1 membrane protein [Enterococcus haemoperoxidus ATCC BAA-382]EOT62792.1 membrane protein [Enterococcus haemoperoxidus ATCC BAA-382]OJG52223.1 membrane protein [Enterococcus haemoperoxidus]
MSIYEKFVQNERLRRFFVLAVVIFILFLARSMITMILLTFIFTFLALHFVKFVQQYLKVPSLILVLATYSLIVFLVYLAVTKYVPVLIHQSVQMYNSVIRFYQTPTDDHNQLLMVIDNYLEKSNLMSQIQNGASILLRYVQDIGSIGLSFILSFILSFFFMIEKKQMAEFSKLFLKSDFDWFFQDIYFFADKFVNTFGVVMEAQFFIAVVNTGITTICLALIGFHQLPSLAIMIFILSLIPVAGVIISCIPLSFIAYSEGGINDVIYILVVIIVVHLFESYVLNPKFMSSKTDLPIFYTFVILLISERLFGVWGLIVGIPIFTFFLDILKVKPIHSVTEKLSDPPNIE